MNDLELLRQYAQNESQASFEAVVSRHIDLVYSAAKRQVRSPDLANEVAQSVFLELAASSGKLRHDTQLGSWLLVATRRRAIDVVRRESTRQRIERTAAEDSAMTTPTASWSQLEPLLDEALGSLREEDRRAIVLRFFEGQSLRDTSRALGCTEDTAQKRVSRALDRLRGFFAERGLVTIGAVLASELSSHAVEPAPAGAAASIATKVVSQMMSVAAHHALRATVLAALKVAAVTTALVGSTAFFAFEAYANHEKRREISSLTAVADRWRNELDALRGNTVAARSKAAQAEAQANAFVSADPDFDQRMRTAFAHLSELRRRFVANPGHQIPEMRHLPFEDWFDLAQSHTRWDTENGWREIMADVRTRAINWSGGVLMQALERYVAASRGRLPTSLDDLAPLCDPALEPDLLARYELKQTGTTAILAPHATVIAQKVSTAIDPDHDNLAVVGLHWSGVTGVIDENSLQAQVAKAADEAIAGYKAAHGGQEPDSKDPAILQPYFSDPKKGEAFVAIMGIVEANRPRFKEENAIGVAHNAYAAAHNGQEPKSAEDLVPYFKYSEDAAVYLKITEPDESSEIPVTRNRP
jgi:RNA polymerase sigma factor (sigma-70 family)